MRTELVVGAQDADELTAVAQEDQHLLWRGGPASEEEHSD